MIDLLTEAEKRERESICKELLSEGIRAVVFGEYWRIAEVVGELREIGGEEYVSLLRKIKIVLD